MERVLCALNTADDEAKWTKLCDGVRVLFEQDKQSTREINNAWEAARLAIVKFDNF